MNKMLVATRALVNPPTWLGDEALSQAWQKGSVKTLAERLQWVLENRGWSARELARKAGLESETHVGLILRNGAAKVETLDKIADAAGVRFEWLAVGRGSPDSVSIDAGDVFPARASAIAAARLVGLSEEAIEHVQGDRVDAGSASEWLERIRLAASFFEARDREELGSLGHAREVIEGRGGAAPDSSAQPSAPVVRMRAPAQRRRR